MTKIFTALLTALLIAASPLAYANGITLNVRDGQVRDVLASVAALSGKSIVADSSVQGTVTLNLKDVPFDTALRIITAAKGLSYRLTGDVILVGSAAGMEKFNDTASIIKLNYAKAEELKTALAPLIGTNSKISTDTVTNSIIFTGTPTDEMRLRSAVAALDTATQQVTLEAKIIAVNREDSENLGISWNWDKSLYYIRALKQLGIAVIFEKENINSLEEDSELRITLSGAFAQSESESISANVTWGKRRAMEAGKVSIQYKKLYGYRKGEDGQPEIIPEQAEIVRWLYGRYLTGASLRMIKEELEQQGIKCSEDSPEWTISRIRSILQNEKYCGDVLMQKTFRQDFINRKAIKNTGQLPMYLIENHHEGIVSREKYDAVQAEMARRNAAKSPSKNAVTGMASYASKYALSERLVCGECGTLYRRCTWTRNGEKRVVWRCVSRLDYGKKYCHNSPTLDEAPLQQVILAALNTAMADKNSLIRQITDAMEAEIIPFPGGMMSLGDIERRLRELEQQFQTLLEKATDDPAAYGGQFKEILDEQTLLKERRSGILADNNEQAKANQRIMDAARTLENASPHITEWDESAVRQLVETVKVLSKDEIAVTLKGGIEIRQKIMY